MSDLLILAADVVAIVVLVFGVYYRRHRGRDMILPFLALNVGVLAVTAVLAGVEIGVGVGLGLFGVLAIIRLRSREISHAEVAYYFAALALGLICGLRPDPVWLAPSLALLIVVVFAVVDRGGRGDVHRHQEVTVDAVYATEADLTARLEQLLSATVDRITVLRTDVVRDLTVVDVRYRVLPAAAQLRVPSGPALERIAR